MPLRSYIEEALYKQTFWLIHSFISSFTVSEHFTFQCAQSVGAA